MTKILKKYLKNSFCYLRRNNLNHASKNVLKKKADKLIYSSCEILKNSFVTFFHFRIHFLLRFLPFFISGGVKVCQDILSQSCTRIFLALNSYEEIYHHCCCWRRRRDGWFLSLNSVSSYFAYIMCHHYITWLET